MTKNYYIQYNVGRAKYMVNYHDGQKTHEDGSAFYDIAIFKNKKELNAFTTDLEANGYTYRTTTTTTTTVTTTTTDRPGTI